MHVCICVIFGCHVIHKIMEAASFSTIILLYTEVSQMLRLLAIRWQIYDIHE